MGWTALEATPPAKHLPWFEAKFGGSMSEWIDS